MGNRRQRKKDKMRANKDTRGNPFGTIPGVPSFQEGGTVFPGLLGFDSPADVHAAQTNPFAFGITQNQPPPAPGGIDRQALIAAGWQEIAPGLWLTDQGRVVSEADLLNPPSPAAPSGPSAPQFRPGELELMQAQLELEQLNSEHTRAINAGNLALARQIEARMAENQRRQLELEGVLGAGQGLSGIGSSLGQLSNQRQQFLSELAANPRDFAQLNIGLGGGESVFNQLLTGQQVGGQSTSLIGQTPTLGRNFNELLRQVNQRPELGIFEEAADRFRSVPGFKGGGNLIVDEPTVAIGMLTGKKHFTLGEGGKPEKVEITPMPFQEGGTVASAGLPQPVQEAVSQFGQGTNIQDVFRAVQAQPAPAPAPVPTPAPLPPPTFPGIQALIAFMGGLPVQNALTDFSQGTGTNQDIFRAVQEQPAFLSGLPRTAGEAIRRITSGLTPRNFFGLLPSQREGLFGDASGQGGLFSALGVPGTDVLSSLLAAFPTGPNPSSVSFGSNFEHGGMVAYMPRAV